jgi:hypothetical protein
VSDRTNDEIVESSDVQDRVEESRAEPSNAGGKRKRACASTPFDYSQLSLEQAALARNAKKAARSFKATLKRTTRQGLCLGRKLIEVQAALKGQFMKWCEAELGYSYRWAAQWMNYAHTFADAEEMIEHLNGSSLGLLAKAPKPILQTVMAKAHKGQVRTKREVERAIAEAQTEAVATEPPKVRSLKGEIAEIRRRKFKGDFERLKEDVLMLSKDILKISAQGRTNGNDAKDRTSSMAAAANAILNSLCAITGANFDPEEGPTRLTGRCQDLASILRHLAVLDARAAENYERHDIRQDGTRLAEIIGRT